MIITGDDNWTGSSFIHSFVHFQQLLIMVDLEPIHKTQGTKWETT